MILGDFSKGIGCRCKDCEEVRKIMETMKENICKKEECGVKEVDRYQCL